MDENGRRYIALMKNVLTDFHRMELGEYQPIRRKDLSWKTQLFPVLNRVLGTKGYTICRKIAYEPEQRMFGLDWPAAADTMIGMKRIENLEFCITDVMERNVEGDFIETGVWRGGATIFMKAMLKALHDTDRTVWAADSFEGLPRPNKEKYKADEFDEHYKAAELAVSLETVQRNFKKYDLLDDRVKFLKGWFKDTLPTAPITKLAIVRLDGDMYESTMDGLVNSYPKLSVDGYLIIDDWNAVQGCKKAVEDYRAAHGIAEPVIDIDGVGAYWKKEKNISGAT